jgi:tRNA threonylcarbamoyladenosine biosynthesis protein TsaE
MQCMETTHTIPDLKALDDLAAEVCHLVEGQTVGKAALLLLYGPLGAGKTAFTKALATVLGVTEVVTSPTFVVMKSYQTAHDRFSSLTHIDAYRIEDEAEAIPLHIFDRLDDPHELVVVEWSEKLPQLEGLPHLAITFVPHEEHEERTVHIKSYGT